MDFTPPLSNRQSILMRPKKKISGHNSENLDKEFQKEEKKLEAKRQKMQVFYEDRRKALWGNKDEKLEVQSKRKDEIDKHLETRTKVMKKENELEKNVSGTLNNQIILATNTEKKMEQDRKVYLKNLMEENKKLMEYRQQLKQDTKQKEIQMEKKQADFFSKFQGI